MKTFLTILIILILPRIGASQTKYHYNINGRLNIDSGYQFFMYDFATRTKYILDKTHRVICAFDNYDRLVWTCSPLKQDGTEIKGYDLSDAYIEHISFSYINLEFTPNIRYAYWGNLDQVYAKNPLTSALVLYIDCRTQFGSLYGHISTKSGKILDLIQE